MMDQRIIWTKTDVIIIFLLTVSETCVPSGFGDISIV